MKFDKKYVKLIFYCIAMNLKIFRLKSEMEVQRKYPDILLIPKNQTKGYKGVMIEFKYLKKEQAEKLQEKQEEAPGRSVRKKQSRTYSDVLVCCCISRVIVSAGSGQKRSDRVGIGSGYGENKPGRKTRGSGRRVL